MSAAHAATFAAVAGELRDLGAAADRLQALVAARLCAEGVSDAALVDAQDADLLAQRLGELAKFLGRYAEALEGDAEDPLGVAIEAIVLGALAARLSGRQAATVQANIDFF